MIHIVVISLCISLFSIYMGKTIYKSKLEGFSRKNKNIIIMDILLIIVMIILEIGILGYYITGS